MTERFMLDDAGVLIDLNNHQFIDYGEECCNLLNELAEENQRLQYFESHYRNRNLKLEKENKELKQEIESLNSQLLRLDKELFCQDCLTCRHSTRIDITVRCANGKGITDYQIGCDFYEIEEEFKE